MAKHRLIDLQWPEFGLGEYPPPVAVDEYEKRLQATRDAMASRGLTHLIVYGDREHFANLQYLTGFDPRFEEALLIVRPSVAPLLLVGNECEGYLTVSPLYVAGGLRHELFPSFSLLDQPRHGSRQLLDILADEGIAAGAHIGCAGWKYYAESEVADAAHAIELPALIVDALRELAGREAVVNATDLFMHPGHGFRSACSAAEIAYLEYSGALASEGMKRMLQGMRDGMLDHDLARLVGYNGHPLCCHMTMVSGDNRDRGLSGPIGARLRRGEPFGCNLGYWGSNVCRAGWIAAASEDLPADAGDYLPAFAGPYFEVMAQWLSSLRIGTPGAELHDIVMDQLPADTFGIQLNPGHLIHMDEWVSSPIYSASAIPIQSGMAIQADVIPDSPTYFSTRMEDGYAIADEALRDELEDTYPACYARCRTRRDFVQETLGIELGEEVLPLSNIPGLVPPFLLEPTKVLAMGV